MMSVTPYLQTLSDEDLKDIAAFYSQYNSTVGQAKNDEELLALGTQLYRFGNIKKTNTCLYILPFCLRRRK